MLAAALYFVRFADDWTTYLPGGALEPIRTSLHASYVEASAPLVALSAGGLIGAGFEVAADYVSRRWLSSLGALAYGLAMIAFGLSHSIWLMVAAAFVWGAASDAFTHGCEVALVDLAGEDLPRALSRMNAWAAVGDLLGPLTLAAISATAFGWRGAFVGLGVMMLSYAALLASQRFPPPHPAGRLPKPLAGVIGILKDPAFIAMASAMALFSLMDEPLAAFLIAFQERVLGRGPAWANGLILAWTAGQLVAFAAFERIAGARPGRGALLAALAGLGVTLPVAIFAPPLAIGLPAMVLFGAASAVFYVTLQARLLALRPGQAGSVGAAGSAIGMLGMLFPSLVGAVADRFGLGVGVGLYALVPLAILPLIALTRR
ncbi:MAG TPA: MFS transporter [Caulobacteraceae bacterium]|nr:MFS transporter [Caulobacteraceae bacterium]